MAAVQGALMMSGRASGPPRRPRNPVARAIRAPAFRQRVVPDKRWRQGRLDPSREEQESPPGPDEEETPGTDETD